MNKRSLSLVLALAMCLSLAEPITAVAVESTEEPAMIYAQEAAENTPAQAQSGSDPAQPAEKAVQEITGVKDAYTFSADTQDAALTAATTGDGALTYASDAPDVAAVDENTGALTLGVAGTATITITAAETDQFQAAEKQVTVTVTKAKQTITGVEEALDLKYKSRAPTSSRPKLPPHSPTSPATPA